MDLDKKIKQELNQQTPEIEAILMRDQGLFDMLFATFRSNMRGWMIWVNIVVLVVSGFMLYCGYQFFTATPEEQMFWGMCTMMLLFIQGMTKQWIFMEVNRSSIMRELKRLELRLMEK